MTLGRRSSRVDLERVSLHPRNVKQREARRIYRALMESLPKERGAVITPPEGSSEDVYARYDNRNVLHGIYRYRDYDLLPLVARFGSTYGYRVVDEAAVLIRSELSETDFWSLDDRQLSVFASLRKVLNRTLFHLDSPAPHDDSTVVKNTYLKHALLYPEDSHLLERLAFQHVFDVKKMHVMLDEMKAGNLPSAISDGFL